MILFKRFDTDAIFQRLALLAVAAFLIVVLALPLGTLFEKSFRDRDGVWVGLELLEYGLEPLLKVSAVFGTRQERAHIERIDRSLFENLRHVAFGDAPGQPFSNGRLAHTGLSHQKRVVFSAAAEGLNDPLNLLLASDEGIDLAGARLRVIPGLTAAATLTPSSRWERALGMSQHHNLPHNHESGTRAADLLRALLTDTRVEGFGARLAVLEAGGEPVAFEYGLHAGANYHFWLPAYEASVSRYSPGILLSLDTMRLGSAEGFRVFDYGFEAEPYKKYFCNRSQTVLEGVAHRQGYAGAMAAAFSMAGADAALAAGERFVSAGLGLSVRRRWASIDACETTVVGRARGIAAAAAAALNKARPQSAVSALGAMLIL